MLEPLFKLILEKTDFLYTVLYQTPFLLLRPLVDRPLLHGRDPDADPRGAARGTHVTAPRAAPIVRDLAVAVAVSAAWVAFYGYRYNVALLNSRRLNWWAFLWWSAGLFVTLCFFNWLRGAVSPSWLALLGTWAVYLGALMVVEAYQKWAREESRG